MQARQAKITHLFHSGYTVETANRFLVFDYYQPSIGKKSSISDGVLTPDYLNSKENIFVFASHNHADHFDPAILNWAHKIPDITYIFSDDIRANTGRAAHHSLGRYQTLSLPGIRIKTFGSTDEGVSFLVETDGLAIFHAGDLNWWHWKGESPAEQERAAAWFHQEINKMHGEAIDIAFFPVDRRLEEYFSVGAEYFANKLHPKLLLPMHFGKDFGASRAFSEKSKDLPTQTITITHQGQEIFFTD